jgi:ribosomal protein S27E
MLIRQNDSRCPNCHGTRIKKKAPPAPTVMCEHCGETWNPTTDGMRRTKVKVIAALSIWKDMIGEIVEILPHNGCNVRVAFPPSRTSTYADIFHPSQLQEVGEIIDDEFSL